MGMGGGLIGGLFGGDDDGPPPPPSQAPRREIPPAPPMNPLPPMENPPPYMQPPEPGQMPPYVQPPGSSGQPANSPPVPDLIDPKTLIDEFAGLQFVETTGPDGRKTRRLMQIPRSPEELAVLEPAREVVRNALMNVAALAQEDNRAAQYFAPFIETWASINDERAQSMARIFNLPDIENTVMSLRNINKRNIEDQYLTTKAEFLAQMRERGLSGSSFEREQLNRMDTSFAESKNKNEIFAAEWGQNFMANTIRNAQAQYGLEDQVLGERLRKSAAEYEGNVQNHNNFIQQRLQTHMAGMQMGDQQLARDAAIKQGAQLPNLVNQQVGGDNANVFNRFNAGSAAQAADNQAARMYDEQGLQRYNLANNIPMQRYNLQNAVNMQHYNAGQNAVWNRFNTVNATNNQRWQMEDGARMQRYGTENGLHIQNDNQYNQAAIGNYQNQMAYYNAKDQGADSGQALLQMGLGVASMAMGGGGMGAMAGMAGMAGMGGIGGNRGGGGGYYYAGPQYGYRQPGMIYPG